MGITMTYSCVKNFMSDLTIQQAPLMVLPASRCNLVTTRYPTELLSPTQFDSKRQAELLALAAELDTKEFGMHRAAAALKELASNTVPESRVDEAPVTWLQQDATLPDPVLTTANPYFDHLPASSWHLLATYHWKVRKHWLEEETAGPADLD
jgi:hypothetical protein